MLLSLLIGVFFLWLLPLGFFIKSSQEKIVCNGQRAICMCHMVLIKTHSTLLAGELFKAATAHQHERGPSVGGVSTVFTVAQLFDINQRAGLCFFDDNALSYRNPYIALFEHVPKA